MAEEEDRRDAERWRALMSSQRFHIMAMNGFVLFHRDGDEANRSKANLEPVPDGDVPLFIKMEFWSEYEDRPFKDAFERELMERYADAIIERREKANGKGRDNSNEVHMRPLQADADL